MKNSYWIVIGAVAGFASGLIFGLDYAFAGAGIGAVGGAAIYLVMRYR